MGRIYTAQFTDVAVSAVQDLFEINCPATGVVYIHALHLGQKSDVKDAEEEILNIQLTTGHTTSGSGGSAPTAIPHRLGDTAFDGTVEVNNTTQAVNGTIVTHYSWDWNIRIGFDYIWTPETRPRIAPSERMCIELPVAPADALTMSGTIVFELV